MKKLVILGGGYGGLSIVQELLEKDMPDDVVIVLVDRMPFHGMKTEYYALASGSASDLDMRVAFPVDARLIMKYGEVSRVALEEKQVHFDTQETLDYDWLVIALGCTDRYHSISGAQTYSNSIQTLSATRKTYQQLNDVKPYGQVSIVGGGLSGVEIASELRESRKDLNIRIIDRGPSILSAFPKKLQGFVHDWFSQHHVTMESNISLTHLEQGVMFHQTGQFTSDAVVWTAGIQPNRIVQNLLLPKDVQGRLLINENHQVPGFEQVYVVGDCASMPFSPSAQLAEAQGKQIAEVLQAIWHNKQPRLGKIKLKGVLGSLGKTSGFGIMGKRPLMGRVPRMLKSGVLWMSKRHFG